MFSQFVRLVRFSLPLKRYAFTFRHTEKQSAVRICISRIYKCDLKRQFIRLSRITSMPSLCAFIHHTWHIIMHTVFSAIVMPLLWFARDLWTVNTIPSSLALGSELWLIRFYSFSFRFRIVRTHRNICMLHFVHLYTLSRMQGEQSKKTEETKQFLLVCVTVDRCLFSSSSKP